MLNPIEEAKFAELRDKCRVLKMPPPPATFVKLKVTDKNGIITFDDIQRAHSWTRNLYNTMYGAVLYYGGGSSSFGAGYLSGKSTINTIHDSSTSGLGQLNPTTVGDATMGIVIGTGDTASSINDYNLATKILHGSSSGTMSYQESNGPAAVYTGATKIWEFTYYRIFNNNSGALITVKECGFIDNYPSQAGKYMLLERTVLSPTVAVADGAQLTVTYVVTLDFSAID